MTRDDRKSYIKKYYTPIIWGKLDNLVDQIFDEDIGTCGECKFYNDIRKCPMSCPDAMDESNYCYNFERKQNEISK